MKIIISCGLADGRPMNNGEYLHRYDPEGEDGMGTFVWTKDRNQAMLFEDALAVLKLYQTVPGNRPWRDDGKPNKPLTAFNIEVEEYKR
jgi:hypothetical protein